MKTSNTVVTGIVIAAVLVFAYGLGLLIRHARTGGPQPGEADKTAVDTRAAQAKEALEARIRNKEKRAEANEKVNTATPEEKEGFRNRVVKDVTNRRGGRGRRTTSAPVPQAQTPPTSATPNAAGAMQPKQDANTPPSPGVKTPAEPNANKTEKTGSESGKAGPG
jgi:cytoskeletal protein RodZ